MAVLVTGGAGYIGSHTCVELLGAGYDIVVLDNFSNAKPDAIDRVRELSGGDFPVYKTDVLDAAGLDEVFAREPIDAVIHFAGLKAVGESVRMPLEYYRVNVTGTLNLCGAMARAGCRRVVFSSSATVYGADNPIPYKEEYPTSAVSPYGMTKVVVERVLEDIASADARWSVASLRYFNPIGAHPSGLLGDDPMGEPNNIAPRVAQVASGKQEVFYVYGDDYDTRDGTGVRDYLHVMDLAFGHLKALEYTGAHSGAAAFNLGAGKGYSVLEVLRAFERASGKKIPYRVAGRRPGDIGEFYADTTKAKNALGWEATRSLDEMCADMWRFVLKNHF